MARRLIDCFSQPQTQISGNLIVAAPARVQLTSGIADDFHQPRLDEGVNIFRLNFVEVTASTPGPLEYCLQGLFDLSLPSVR